MVKEIEEISKLIEVMEEEKVEKYITVQGNNDYLIECKLWESSVSEQVVIACHGFAGDKESSAISMLAEAMLKENITTIAFDLPGHGESKVGGDCLTISNCLNDFKSVIDYTKKKYKDSKINIFATSYGAYLTLLLLNQEELDIKSVVLRCPAIRMDEIFLKEILREDVELFKHHGFTIVGYERELKVNYDFYLELKSLQLLEIYKNKYGKILIIHGDEDKTAPIEDAISFSKKFGILLKIVKGADHRFKKPGELEQVVTYAINFIK